MSKQEVLALGKYFPQDLSISIGESNRKVDSQIESTVDGLWEAKEAKAKTEGRVCYNGISYRLNSLKEKDGKLAIEFGLLEFKVRSVLPTIPEYLELAPEFYLKGCYNSASVKTSDGQYLVVALSGKSMNPHEVDLIGGIMEKPLEINTAEDVFQSVYQELEEEACIHKEDIAEIYLRAVFMSSRTNICFYFEVILNKSADVLLERFARETEDQDIKSVQALYPDEYLTLLKNHSSATKQMVLEFLKI